MPTPDPLHCRREAYAYLQAHLPQLETTYGLVHCVLALSMHEMGDVSPERVDAELNAITTTIGERIQTTQARAVLAHTHEVLFQEYGFEGNKAAYNDPRNSYLPAVLQTRKGIPISLTLLYKAVVEPLGVRVLGVNAPYHFLAAVADLETHPSSRGTTPVPEMLDDTMLLVDPFYRGHVLTRDEAVAQISRTAGQPLEGRAGDLFPPATHTQWLLRMIQNLIGNFERDDNRTNVAAMLELRALVEAAAPKA